MEHSIIYDPTLQSIFKSIQDPALWTEHDTYYLFNPQQGTDSWLHVRLGRVTGSAVGACVGRSIFATPQQKAQDILGKVKPEFTEIQQENMNYGTKGEPIARVWYQKRRGVKVNQVGIIIPKWNPFIGVSVDGIIEGQDGIIEIKVVKKMYLPLRKYSNMIPSKRPTDMSHLWPTHYDQMILGMAIIKKSFCDYIVLCPPEKCVFVERIPFNRLYWETDLYPKIKNFIEAELKPNVDGTMFPLMPTSFRGSNHKNNPIDQ